LRWFIITQEVGTNLGKKIKLKLLEESERLTKEVVFTVYAPQKTREGISGTFCAMMDREIKINERLGEIGTDLRFFNTGHECFALIHKKKMFPDEKVVTGMKLEKFTVVLEQIKFTLEDIQKVSLEY